MIEIIDGFEIELFEDVLYSDGEDLILFECEICNELAIVSTDNDELSWSTYSDSDGCGFFEIDGVCDNCRYWQHLGTEVNYK